jgi:Fic family protein
LKLQICPVYVVNMNLQDFDPNQQTNLVQTLGGALAYVPPPLPPIIDLSPLAMSLAGAAIALGELKGAARRLQNPEMLIMPLFRKEALISSAIEGTVTTLNNMLLEQILPNQSKDENAKEAYNYVRALTEANEQLKRLPLSHRVIKDAHRVLLSGLSTGRGAGKRPGEYKNSQNAIGQIGDTEKTAKYVPPPPKQTQSCMDELEVFMNRERQSVGEALIDLACVHYQFEAIHPFNDGNGRIGRMLVTLMAQQTGLIDQPLFHISANLESKKSDYIELLYRVSTQADWVPWISFFLTSVEESCKSATAIVDRILQLQIDLKQKALAHEGNHRLATVIDALFVKASVTTADVQKICGTHFQTAQSDLRELEALGIVELTWPRPAIYTAKEIWNFGDRT